LFVILNFCHPFVIQIFEQDRALVSSESGAHVGGEMDSVKACQLFFSVLHNCFGRVDPWIQDCMDLMLARMFGQGNAETVCTVCTVCSVCTVLTIHCIALYIVLYYTLYCTIPIHRTVLTVLTHCTHTLYSLYTGH
jgi:hypothetical protein